MFLSNITRLKGVVKVSSNTDEQRTLRVITDEHIDGMREDPATGEMDEREWLKNKLLQAFQYDQLFPMVSKDYDIISDDILNLDTDKSYSTKEVAEIVSKYDYLYDAVKGESYINENRLRWWLNDKDPDNFLKYFNLEKVGRSWVWKIESICKAKIVAILRFCKNQPQKQIIVRLTGLMPDTPRITHDNIASLIESGNLNQVHSVESLREILYAAVVHMTNNYAEVYGQLESLKEENDELKSKLALFEETTSSVKGLAEAALPKSEFESNMSSINEATSSALEKAGAALSKSEFEESKKELQDENDKLKKQLEQLEKENEKRIEQRDQQNMIFFKERSFKSDLRKKALAEWDKQGLLKRITSKESDKEQFIESYIAQHIGPLMDEYKATLYNPNRADQENSDKS